MPISDPRTRAAVMRQVATSRPKRVLDIGVGEGFFGRALQELSSDIEVYGIEIFPQYLTAEHVKNYRTIFVCDARTFEYEMLRDIDLVIAADVLEHFTKDEFIQTVNTLKQYFPRILITLPLRVIINGVIYFFTPQGAVGGNPYEAHLSEWTMEEIKALGFQHVEGGLTREYMVACFEWKR